VVLDVSEYAFGDLSDYVERTFRHVADQRRLDFELDFARGLPRAVHTDAKRLQQVLKNLLSNAFKFTERGKVSLEVLAVTGGWSPENEVLARAGSAIALSVRDTGIGIPPDKQQIIFEAFQQADGSTSRKYGGTGLGLAISRELARVLGGEIKLLSVPGQGSVFTLYLPSVYAPVRAVRRKEQASDLSPLAAPLVASPAALFASPLPAPPEETLPRVEPAHHAAATVLVDDSADVRPGDRVLLVIENDAGFARILFDVARDHGFKAVLAHRGGTALLLARERRPSAITLDINLPDIDGWRVLDRLKQDPATRHVPVQVITTEEETARALRMGARRVLHKPLRTRDALDETFARLEHFVTSRQRRVLLVEQDEAVRADLAALLGGDDVVIRAEAAGGAALSALRRERFDLLVLGLELADMRALELIDAVARDGAHADLPLLVYAPGAVAAAEEAPLGRLAQTLVLKDVRSRERLFDEAALFLHRPVAELPAEKREIIEQLHQSAEVLAGKQALIVDDDIRNIFALTTILDAQGMRTLSAETGRQAIDLLEHTPAVDVVLMDIMMPEMDGYDTMRAIRRVSAFQSLPIIAVTAKAMKGDREKCFEAGATDYISKPVDPEQLLGMLRVWLHR
jgi:CheY-like chemotaxis protein